MGWTSIIVVAYNHRDHLAGCVRALESAGLPHGTRLVLVDNASADGTADFVRAELLAPGGATTRGGLPALFIANAENLGYAGGNNQALRRAMADGDEFAYLLNPDTEVVPGFLERALEAAASDDGIAEVQSLLVRLPGGDVVNTWGNALHFLGFGYAAGDGTRLDDAAAGAHTAAVHDVAYASGAGVLVRLAALARIGLFNEELFAYHEDLELSWRARLAGYRVVVAPASRVGHRYDFGRSPRKLYFMERNRLLVLAWCYRAPTLALLAPALLAMEAGLWLYAARAGFWREKARAYAYLLRAGELRALRETRRQVQALRTVSDREATRLFTGEVVFPAVEDGDPERVPKPPRDGTRGAKLRASHANPWLLRHVANPIFRGYWRAARALMRW